MAEQFGTNRLQQSIMCKAQPGTVCSPGEETLMFDIQSVNTNFGKIVFTVTEVKIKQAVLSMVVVHVVLYVTG